MATPNLEIDVLRSLLALARLGGLRQAAEHVGRSQSAVSQQLHKLEQQTAQQLLQKSGRGLRLTEAGELMASYARRLIELNDEAVGAVSGAALAGAVRFGLPGDFAETWLPLALGRFKRLHQGVRVEVAVDRNGQLLEKLDRGELDLVLAMGYGTRPDARRIASMAMAWIGPAAAIAACSKERPLELALYNPPCFFRKACISALEQIHQPWQLTYTTGSLQSLWAGVAASLGITVRTASGIPDTLRSLGEKEGLPSLPHVDLCLHAGGRPLTAAASRLWEVVAATIRQNLAAADTDLLQPASTQAG